MKSILKSLFISLFPVLALIVVIHTFWYFMNNGFSAYYRLGRGLVALTIVVFFLGLFIKPVARTEANPKTYTFAIILGFLISTLFGTITTGDVSVTWPTLGLVAGWFIYIYWYSVFEDRTTNKILQKGKELPELALTNGHGDEVKTNVFLGNPSIFLFYRGNWCPLCMAQIKEIAQHYKALEERKVNTILISPQPHTYSKRLSKKFDVNFNFLVDKGNVVAKQLDIFAPNGIPMGFQTLGYDSDTVMPTVIITDAEGKIIFVDLTDNYRVRPEPETFLRILDEHQVG